MDVLIHHIYEYTKGLRHLVLHTIKQELKQKCIDKLVKKNICYHIVDVSDKKSNIFFGDKVCVDIVKLIDKSKLNNYSPEEDFILGTILGYDRMQQCNRYLKKKKKEASEWEQWIG